MNSVLDNLPVGTIVFLASIVLIIIAYISNDVSFEGAFTALGLAGGGSGAIGIARAQSGKGLRGN
jgi:hypothetical protein